MILIPIAYLTRAIISRGIHTAYNLHLKLRHARHYPEFQARSSSPKIKKLHFHQEIKSPVQVFTLCWQTHRLRHCFLLLLTLKENRDKSSNSWDLWKLKMMRNNKRIFFLRELCLVKSVNVRNNVTRRTISSICSTSNKKNENGRK